MSLKFNLIKIYFQAHKWQLMLISLTLNHLI